MWEAKLTHKRRPSVPKRAYCGIGWSMLDPKTLQKVIFTKGTPTCAACARAISTWHETYRVRFRIGCAKHGAYCSERRSKCGEPIYGFESIARRSPEDRLRDYFEATSRSLL